MTSSTVFGFSRFLNWIDLFLPSFRDNLYSYIGGIILGEGGVLIESGGIPDHIHLMIRLKYEDRELDPSATIRNFRIVQTESSRDVSRTIDHYNLDAIIAVGYRVRSHRGMQFRTWATERLRE